jgi:hypothetical protein
MVVGAVRVAPGSYHCPDGCGGFCPHDAALRLTDAELSAGAREVVGLAGTLGSVAEAAQKVLPRLAGLRLAESTVERATERAGAEVGRRLGPGRCSARRRTGRGSRTPPRRRVPTSVPT